jgi:hypothetical protein
MEGEQEKLLRLRVFPVTEDLTTPRRETALHQFSIAALNDRGRQIWLAQRAKGLPMEPSAPWGLEANLKEGFLQTRVTMPKTSLANQTVGPKVPEGPLTLLTDRPVGHLPGVAAYRAQTVMGAAVHSGAVVGVAQGASPVAAFQVATVAVAAADKSPINRCKLTKKRII